MVAVSADVVLPRGKLAEMARQDAQQRDRYEYDSTRWHYWEARRIRHTREAGAASRPE